jgi:hypothetical protein
MECPKIWFFVMLVDLFYQLIETMQNDSQIAVLALDDV